MMMLYVQLDQSIEKFKPPRNAPLADIMKWEDEVSAMIKKISQMTTGGSALREYIRSEVRRMQLFRFDLFCKYVSSSPS